MQKYRKILGEEVRKARVKAGLSQAKLAELLGMDTRTILNIEAGRGNPNFDNLVPLLRFLKVPVDIIFYPESASRDINLDKITLTLMDCDSEDLEKLLPAINYLIGLMDKK